MPSVAFALKNYVTNRPPAAQPPQAPDRAPPTPFASLLDDNAPAAEPLPPSAADDSGPRAARSDQAQQPAKSADSKDNKAPDNAKSGDTDNDAKTGKAGKTETTGDGKPDADAKIADTKAADKTGQPTDGKDATPVSDGKTADAPVAADLASAPPSDPMPTIATVDAISPALVAPTGIVPAAAAATDKAVIVATVAAPAKADALAALQAGAAKADALATLQAGAAKADNEAALTAKAVARTPGEAKPQVLAGDAADKDAVAQARGELARSELARSEPADTAHHAATPQAQTAPAADAIAAAPKAATDAVPPTVLTVASPTSAPAAPTTAASAPMPPPAAIPFAGVAIEIASKALAGKNHFEIRLDPPELGRIEVRLDVDRDGNVTSRMIADRADTLDLLRRDASGLERALQDAGLKTSDNGLQFSLRDQSAQQQQADRANDIARLVVQDETLPANDTAPRSYSRLAGLGSGVDIQV